MTRLWLAMATSAVALAGCAMRDGQGAAEAPSTPGVCRGDGLAALVGKPFKPALATDAQARSGAKVVRVLRPGEMATMEFRADRLTIHLDDSGAVASARCG